MIDTFNMNKLIYGILIIFKTDIQEQVQKE
jgi:hypothetical protein